MMEAESQLLTITHVSLNGFILKQNWEYNVLTSSFTNVCHNQTQILLLKTTKEVRCEEYDPTHTGCLCQLLTTLFSETWPLIETRAYQFI